MNSKLTYEDVGYRKQHSMAEPLLALKIGRRTQYGLAGSSQTIQDFFWKGSELSDSLSM